VAETVASLSDAYEKRQQEREARREELQAAGHDDPTVQAVADIENTKLLLEGEQDRMQSSDELSKSLSDLATKLDSDSANLRSLLSARRQTAAKAEAEMARMKADTQEMSLALKNLAMLPSSSENDEFMQHLSDRLNHLDETLRIDEKRSQQAQLQLRALEADQRQLDQASRQARARAVAFDTASRDAKVNQDLLVNRLEFSVARKRADEELSNVGSVLKSSLSLRSSSAIQEAALGDAQSRGAVAKADRRSVDDLRDCIRRTGDVSECRASPSTMGSNAALSQAIGGGGAQP
jgi:hypothetical protein